MKNRHALILGVFVLGSTCWAQVTQRVSVSFTGAEGNWQCQAGSITPDGRYVVFSSGSTNLVPGDTNGVWDAFLRDRQTGSIERISVDSSGLQANGTSIGLGISADGRYVAFTSFASNLVPGDTNGHVDGFVRDRLTGTTERVSLTWNGAEGDGDSGAGWLSADGRYVVINSDATNLVLGDTNGASDVFVRDRQMGTIEIVSGGAVQANGESGAGQISADGRYVVFSSAASNLVVGDTNGVRDVFVRDRVTSAITRASVASSGAQIVLPPFADDSNYGWISSNGRYVGFFSIASNLVAGDTNQAFDVFVHDMISRTTERVSLDSSGVQGNADSFGIGSISSDGRYVAFLSAATNLVPGDSNGQLDIFVRDRRIGTTERLNVDSSGLQANGGVLIGGVVLSDDGRYAAFDSMASNLVQGDTNGASDVFVHDRAHPGFASLCDPGVAGVIACPCANPPSGSERGCDNSAGTGGASLSASGGEYLSSDSVVFTTSGGKPTALHVVLQGTGSLPAGAIYGQGVRCVGGSLKRLYARAAIGGSITAPDFGAGEATVHARSAAVGDVIAAGSTRWYMVFYRDPIVLGGCSAGSTFNTTQTRAIPWLP